MRHKPTKRHRSPSFFVVANSRITAHQVKVVDEQGDLIGVMQTREAIEAAYEQNKDLILINEQQTPPIAKIIELNKYKYQQQQKESASRKKAKAQEIKEVRFTPFMSEGDFQSRLKKVIDFLKDGDKVKLSIFYKGRLITKKEFGEEIMSRVFSSTSDIATIELEPKMIGKKLIAQLLPKKK